MGKREENRKRLADLGIQIGEDEALAPMPEADPDPDLHPEPLTEGVSDPAPVDDDPEPSPEEPREPLPDATPDHHNWEKRKADAQAAQRALSLERVALKAEQDAVATKRRELEDLLARLEQAKAQVPEPSSDEDDAFEEEYPDLAKAVERKANRLIDPLKKELGEAKARLEAQRQAQADEAEALRAKAVLDAVKAKIPDAVQIATSHEFSEWLDGKAPGISKQYRDIIERTSLYTPEDAISVLTQYRNETRPATSRQPSDVRVAVRPDASSTASAGSAHAPLTLAELGDIDKLMRSARSNAERDVLKQRLALTLNQNT